MKKVVQIVNLMANDLKRLLVEAGFNCKAKANGEIKKSIYQLRQVFVKELLGGIPESLPL